MTFFKTNRNLKLNKALVTLGTLSIFGIFSCADRQGNETKFTVSNTDQFSVLRPNILKGEIENNFGLFKNYGDSLGAVPLQSDGENKWFLSGIDAGTKSQTEFIIKEGADSPESSLMKVAKTENDFLLNCGDIPLLAYRYTMQYPPLGVDSLYAKSGYVHPLLSPAGDTLTRIQPPDHYHHYGLWGPWTKTKIDEKEVDFWNLGSGQGTVLFKELLSTYQGPLFSGVKVRQEHIDLTASAEKRLALIEDLDIKAWRLNKAKDRYIIDYTSKFTTPLESGVLFDAYRYGGGLGFRFTERWDNTNSGVLTSEGKTRMDADGTGAKWCIISGEASDGEDVNGVLFLSHVDNKSYPEPMRVWPMDANNGRGDMFFEFCPIRHEEWFIEKGKKYSLQYRLVVFEGKMSPEEAEAHWNAFAHPTSIDIDTK